MSLVAIVPGEQELGPQRLCPDCREWWPADGQFFAEWAHWSSPRCRACQAAREAAADLRRRLEAAAVAQEARRAVWRAQQASWRARHPRGSRPRSKPASPEGGTAMRPGAIARPATATPRHGMTTGLRDVRASCARPVQASAPGTATLLVMP